MPAASETSERCERNGCLIEEGEERHHIYGALWCAACADDPDQYDSLEDYDEQRAAPAGLGPTSLAIG